MRIGQHSSSSPSKCSRPATPRKSEKKSRQTTAVQEGHYSYTVRMEQLTINPIPASRRDLITEKWPRRFVAQSSSCDVINDLKIGGVTLTDTSLPAVAWTRPSEAPWATLRARPHPLGAAEHKHGRTERQHLDRGVPLSATNSARLHGTTATRAIHHKKQRRRRSS